MFTVIYSFKVIPGNEEQFEKTWHEMTQQILIHAGSRGSRLHMSRGSEYIAYAQWPNKSTWEKMGDALPESAREVGKQMRSYCISVKVLYELKVIDDLFA